MMTMGRGSILEEYGGIEQLERHTENMGSSEKQTGSFKLPRCATSSWGRIAVFLAYRKGSLPGIGTYNHIMLVLAPATPDLYLKGPRSSPDGAFLYELTGTAGEFIQHASLGRTISTTRVTPLNSFTTLERLKFLYLGFSECGLGAEVDKGEDDVVESLTESEDADNDDSAKMTEVTDSIVTLAATSLAPTLQQRWRAWEDNSGLAFVHPWHHTMLELKLRHDELFKIQRKSGIPFAAAINALFPSAKNHVGGQNHKRYNFATYNCGHYVRELLTAAFGMEESVAQMIMLDDLEPSGLPGKWHSHSPFAVVNPKMTGAFETAAGFGRSEGGAARMRCLAKPTAIDGMDGRKDLLDDNFACFEAWQKAKWEFGDDSGVQTIQGGYKQFYEENYGEIWVASAAGTKRGRKLRRELKTLMTKGEKLDAVRAASKVSAMGTKVTFKDFAASAHSVSGH